jgi:hypothetical protein
METSLIVTLMSWIPFFCTVTQSVCLSSKLRIQTEQRLLSAKLKDFAKKWAIKKFFNG